MKKNLLKHLLIGIIVLPIYFTSCNKDDDPYAGFNFETFTDPRDGQEYKIVLIGNQWWMAENLAYIHHVFRPADGSTTEPRYYVYNYSGVNVSEAVTNDNFNTYGVLYNYPAAIASVPEGWHLPSDAEWEQLAQYVSNSKGPYEKDADDWLNVGKHLKAKSGWENSGNGTNDFGFSALPGGIRNMHGIFEDHVGTFAGKGYNGQWWSSTENSEVSDIYQWIRILTNDSEFSRFYTYKDEGLSVRCVKD